MAELEEQAEDTPKKKSKLPLVVGLVLAIALGAGGFFAMYSGMLMGGGHADSAVDASGQAGPLDRSMAFVPLEPLIVSLGPGSANRHLKFAAQLEVSAQHEDDVTLLVPRVLDVLNGYLRAVDVRDLEDPQALIRLRAQMLRRIQIVTGEGRVRDLLITEFVLN
ncbi:flagellar basal body-associated protein FliL [Actibacterium sp. XHP0104]|uniref:flagellar basal body-associated FliL family protein n=1 Tax=Actibacterium sp. XHP0104 TaxID=2984335 RepID=UPI0021E88816|nr:flagellar basal body-associated FliL family protein [Actibacterium sp. XHP0104]MCV2881817.1 flagellar basal body-associated FliL family protein [Actibacterium sp. XHP0104]